MHSSFNLKILGDELKILPQASRYQRFDAQVPSANKSLELRSLFVEYLEEYNISCPYYIQSIHRIFVREDPTTDRYNRTTTCM